MFKVSDFDYYLPEELIAQHPAERREESKLFVYNRTKDKVEHRIFSDVLEYFNEGDCIVFNDTRVIPARLLGKRKDTGGKIEFVLLEQKGDDTWEVIVKPGRRAKEGVVFVFGEGELEAEVIDRTEDGGRIVKLKYEGNFKEVLDRVGIIPLPPYIHEELRDKERYQTVYSKHRGSAAAPTAGLHFTSDLIKRIEEKGVKTAKITLHVGLGTFRPVKVENIEEHNMHSEVYNVSKEAANIINKTKASGRKIFAVGTTSVRTLESCSDERGVVEAKEGRTDIFIYPGYKFKVVDSLITNFHLPKSTLIMLVSAFAGHKKTLDLYNEAVVQKYRFFSFGDSMLLL